MKHSLTIRISFIIVCMVIGIYNIVQVAYLNSLKKRIERIRPLPLTMSLGLSEGDSCRFKTGDDPAYTVYSLLFRSLSENTRRMSPSELFKDMKLEIFLFDIAAARQSYHNYLPEEGRRVRSPDYASYELDSFVNLKPGAYTLSVAVLQPSTALATEAHRLELVAEPDYQKIASRSTFYRICGLLFFSASFIMIVFEIIILSVKKGTSAD